MAVQPVPPDYDRDISRLVAAYKRAVREIQRELAQLDPASIDRAIAQATLAEIARILSSLNEESAAWVAAVLPEAARSGVARTLLAQGVARTAAEARTLVRFNRANQAMLNAAIQDTQADLLAVTQNVERRVRAAVREAMAESMRANMARNITGRRTISRDTLEGIRQRLGRAADSGIVDAAGRRWRPEVYVETVTRTKLMQVDIDAATNEAVQRGTMYGIISTHRATDACRYHEGRIIKLTPEAPGDYPTYAELKATNQIFHPNCRHTITPVRDIERLPADVRQRAERQAARGNAAVATGKRNPAPSELKL